MHMHMYDIVNGGARTASEKHVNPPPGKCCRSQAGSQLELIRHSYIVAVAELAAMATASM